MRKKENKNKDDVSKLCSDGMKFYILVEEVLSSWWTLFLAWKWNTILRVGNRRIGPRLPTCCCMFPAVSLSLWHESERPSSKWRIVGSILSCLFVIVCLCHWNINELKKWDFHPQWKEWHHTSGTQNPEMCQLTLRMKFTRCKHDNYWTDEREGPTPLHPEELHHMCNWNWNPLMHRRTMPLVLYEFGLEGPTQIVHR